MPTTTEQFISGANDCAAAFDIFSGITTIGGSAYFVDDVYYNFQPTGPDWPSVNFGINQWSFAALPPGQRISSFQVKIYGIFASDFIFTNTNGSLGRITDLTVSVAPDLNYAAGSSKVLSLSPGGQDLTLVFPVSAGESAVIQANMTNTSFALNMVWSGVDGDAIGFDALTLGFTYEASSGPSLQKKFLKSFSTFLPST